MSRKQRRKVDLEKVHHPIYRKLKYPHRRITTTAIIIIVPRLPTTNASNCHRCMKSAQTVCAFFITGNRGSHHSIVTDELRAVLIRSYQSFLVDSRYSGCNTQAIVRQIQDDLHFHYGDDREFETIVSLGDFVIRSHANRSMLFCKIPLDDKIVIAYATPVVCMTSTSSVEYNSRPTPSFNETMNANRFCPTPASPP